MGRIVAAGLAALVMTGCSKGPQTERSTMHMATYDIAAPAEAPAPAPALADTTAKIAYSYSLSYTIRGDDIAAVQQRQIALCTRLGLARCRVATSSIAGAGSGRGSGASGIRGNTKLLVDARLAQAFIRRLDAVVDDTGGTLASRQTDAEDVTKQVIDTDARVRAKQALADRLLRLIQNADGKVGDLVAAEKAFADVQEELDAARSTQAALRQRVAMSDIAIDYGAAEADGIASPIAESLYGAGRTLGASVATLVTFIVSALPWIALLSFVIWLLRRKARQPLRWPRRRGAPSAAVPPPPKDDRA